MMTRMFAGRRPLPAALATVVAPLLALLLVAAPAAVPPAHAAAEQEARAVVQNVIDNALKVLSRGDISKEERKETFHRLFNEYFAVQAIGQFTLGRYWPQASAEQKQRYLDVFERFVVATYTTRLGEYAGEKVQILGSGPQQSGAYVDSQVVRPTGQPIPLTWILRPTPSGELKIVDVRVKNISMAVTQRDDFAAIIQQKGGSLDEFIATLRQKADQLDRS